MKIRMQLISDVVFGNGESIPGGEDISILSDEHGFPYYKGGTFKGIFREELRNYLTWTMTEADKIDAQMKRLLGADSDDKQNPDKLVFSDFTLSEYVKQQILAETGDKKGTPRTCPIRSRFIICNMFFLPVLLPYASTLAHSLGFLSVNDSGWNFEI